jgi:hypothetical protein
MFILYAVAIGLLAGLALGGRPAGLAALRFRWSGRMLAGLGVQLVLFSGPVADRVGALGPPIYVASTALVFVAVLANRSIRGMRIVAVGAASNLAAIVANGGFMPASATAMEVLGKTDPSTYSNSDIVADPMLAPLTDIFAMPDWLPLANVFSIGDVLIGLGMIVVIVTAMRTPTDGAEPTTPASGAEPAAAG